MIRRRQRSRVSNYANDTRRESEAPGLFRGGQDLPPCTFHGRVSWEMIKNILAGRYEVMNSLPGLAPGEQRFELALAADPRQHCMAVLVRHETNMDEAGLREQQEAIARMSRADSPHLCRILEFNTGPGYYYILMEHAGHNCLRDTLRDRRKLEVDEVFHLCGQIVTALEDAVQSEWPTLSLGSRAVYLNTCESPLTGSRLKLPVPSLPLSSAVRIDPEQTVTISPASLVDSDTDVPKNTREYVRPLAELISLLLGQPLKAGAGQSVYRPIAELGPQPNEVMRQVLSTSGEPAFEDVGSFLRALDIRERRAPGASRLDAAVYRPPQAGAPAASTISPAGAPPSIEKQVTVPFSLHGKLGSRDTLIGHGTAQPRAAPEPVPSIGQEMEEESGQTIAGDHEAQKAHGNIRVPERFQAWYTPCKRMRLLPPTEQHTIIGLVSTAEMNLGRDPMQSDFVAQFRPRNPVNDSRTRKISRAQLNAEAQGERIIYRHSGSVNPTLHNGRPMDGAVHGGTEDQFSLAAEYTVIALRTPSAFDGARRFEGLQVPMDDYEEEIPDQEGGVVFISRERSVLAYQTAWIFTDIGFNLNSRQEPQLGNYRPGEMIARFHRFAGIFLLESNDDTGRVEVEGHTLERSEAAPLADGMQVRLGQTLFTANVV